MSAIDTGTDELLADVDEDGVAVVTFNRPQRRNATTPAVHVALARLLASLEADSQVGALVMTGAGDAFCAGADVSMMSEAGSFFGSLDGDQHVIAQRLNQRETVVKLWSMAKPTIAMVPGPAVGAGLGFALACDLRYAAATSLFTTGFARVGLSGDFGVGWLLTQLVGPARAKELLFFSDRLDASGAHRLGLVNEVVPADQLREHVISRARQLAAGPRIALRHMKENVNRAVVADFGDYSDVEVLHHTRTRRTEDRQEAARAFLDKRPPAFRGR